MHGRAIFSKQLASIVTGLAGLTAACNDPTKPSFLGVEVPEEEICEASANWLPNTPELPQFLPVPHPAGECPFYRSGWQNFLVAMQPDAQGAPALLKYPTIDQVFEHTVPRPPNRSFLGDIKQAGGRQILIDQNGNSLYYGIHVNQAFQDFILAYGLQTAAALRAYPSDPKTTNLVFPPGVVEFKSAWQIVEGDTPQAIADMKKDYIVIDTTVPTITQDPVTHVIHEDRNMPRPVTVRLLAIHVVSTLVGHPEFIWASFEHTTHRATGLTDTAVADNQRDVAPILPADENPRDEDPSNMRVDQVVSAKDYILYKAGTKGKDGNHAFTDDELRLVGQKFMRADDMNLPAQTSIYRMFPASKSNTKDADAAITSLNHNVEVLFAQHGATDMRGNYRLLGAQWMDKPYYFDKDIPIQNDQFSPMLQDNHRSQDGQLVPAITLDTLKEAIKNDGSDSEFSILAGEDRMSSTAMESFTQPTGSFHNCFTCHNTQAITASGIPTNRDTPTAIKLLDPGLLNVSHILSQFLLEEYEDAHPAP
jgi:hypothetical protein